MNQTQFSAVVGSVIGIATALLLIYLFTDEPNPDDRYQHEYMYDKAPDTMDETCAWLSQAYSSNGAAGIRAVLKPMAIHKTPNVLACMYDMIERQGG